MGAFVCHVFFGVPPFGGLFGVLVAKCQTVVTSGIGVGGILEQAWNGLGAFMAGDHVWSLVGVVLELSLKTMLTLRSKNLSMFSSSYDFSLSTKLSPSFFLSFFL